MSVREILLAALLTLGLGLVVAGVARWSDAAALIVAGVGVAALAVLLFVEVDG